MLYVWTVYERKDAVDAAFMGMQEMNEFVVATAGQYVGVCR